MPTLMICSDFKDIMNHFILSVSMKIAGLSFLCAMDVSIYLAQ